MENTYETANKIAQRIEYTLAHQDSIEKIAFLTMLVRCFNDEQIAALAEIVDRVEREEQEKRKP